MTPDRKRFVESKSYLFKSPILRASGTNALKIFKHLQNFAKMNSISDVASKEAGQATENPENPLPRNGGKDTVVTEASVIMEAQFSQTMLHQMKTLIKGVVEGAVEKRLHTFRINPRNANPLGEAQEGGGSKSTPVVPKPKPVTPSIAQGLVARLPLTVAGQEEGFSTNWESPDEEGPEEPEENLGEDTDNAWVKKYA